MNNTKNIIRTPWLILLLTYAFETYCQDKVNPTNLIKKMEVAVGGWDRLWEQKDVQFNYDYHYTMEGKRDVSIERYIFEGEHSWAKYTIHEINVMPEAEGIIIQSLVNNTAKCSLDGKMITDPEVIGTTDFLRRANFFWFTMMFKLNNPGAVHEYQGMEKVKDVDHHKVKVSFESDKTGKKQNDSYILYIHPTTYLVDHFYFSLPAFGVNEPILKMKLEYEEINGLKLPTKRYVYQPGEDGKLSTNPGLIQTCTNVKFNNGFTLEDLGI